MSSQKVNRIELIEDDCRVLNIYSLEQSMNLEQVANGWYSFSHLMPSILLKLGYRISDNAKKHSIVKIAYEELGEGIGSSHDQLFYESCRYLKLSPKIIPLDSIEWLKQKSDEIVNDPEILGFCFGLEFTAVENIDLLFHSLLSNDKTKNEQLSLTPFFKIHFTNEADHIAANIKNLNEFINTDNDFKFFRKGCQNGLMFWKQFWNEMKEGELI